jgi:hypothetical protein
MRLAVSLVALLVSASPVFAQDTYTRISSVVELPSGSIAALDDGDREVWLLQPDLSQRRRLVSSGSGPGEARTPMWLVPGPRGSVMLWDASQTRLTNCTPSKKPECVTVPIQGQAPALQLIGSGPNGNSYHVMPPRITASAVPDSATVFRFNPATGAFDSVASIEWAPSYMMERVKKWEGNIQTNRMQFAVPMVAGDQYGITPKGELVVVPAYGRELLVYNGMKSTRIPLQPGRPLQNYLAAEKDSPLHQADSLGFGESLRKAIPSSKRAFRPGSLRITPASHLWISFYEAEKSTRRGYDGYALSGKRLGEVDVAINCRIVGVGRKVYYTACKDEDDLETLAAAPLPAWEK